MLQSGPAGAGGAGGGGGGGGSGVGDGVGAGGGGGPSNQQVVQPVPPIGAGHFGQAQHLYSDTTTNTSLWYHQYTPLGLTALGQVQDSAYQGHTRKFRALQEPLRS